MLKKTVPVVRIVLDPAMVQFLTVLIEASAMKRIVLLLVPRSVLTIDSWFPPVLRPSIVTLFAPLRSIKGPAIEPETETAPVGLTVSDVQPWFVRSAVVPSLVLATTLTAIVLPA